MPEFSKALKESIRSKLVYVHQTHTKRMNDFLKKHIFNITKDDYCTKEEHRVLRDQVINRIKSMGIKNTRIYKVHKKNQLRYKITITLTLILF